MGERYGRRGAGGWEKIGERLNSRSKRNEFFFSFIFYIFSEYLFFVFLLFYFCIYFLYPIFISKFLYSFKKKIYILYLCPTSYFRQNNGSHPTTTIIVHFDQVTCSRGKEVL